MRISAIALAFLLTSSAAFAQNQAPQAQAPQQNWVVQNWFPQDVENFGQNAISRTEFSFDHSMLVLASKADQDDDSLRRVIVGIDGISVHRFKFQGVGMYDPQILNAVRRDYSMAGWQHISRPHEKYGYPGGTDLWIHLDHNTIRNVAFLIARSDQVAFVSVSGSISPIDLLHLAGHFGIPRIQGGFVVQEPGAVVYQPNASAPSASDSGNPAQSDEDYRHPNPAPQASSPSAPN
ncbi:MAG: hypothetical protein JOZ14_19120 [Acidobacteria bacterium]|nr:hypothetical protein [Acidobacteriota bacterium]